MKRTILALAIACMLVSGGGCVCCPGLCAPGAFCDGAARGPRGPVCAQPCTVCGDSSCTGCDVPCYAPCGPLTWLFAIFAHGYCGDGCGDTYWGDFHESPPNCCEPCDRLGRWTGGGASGCATGHCTGGVNTTDCTFRQRMPRVAAGAARPTPAQPITGTVSVRR